MNIFSKLAFVLSLTFFIAVQSYAYDCSNLPQFKPLPGTQPVVSEVVQNNGRAYRCIVPGWCNSGGAAFEPGTGWAYTNAWTDLGACDTITRSSSLSSVVVVSSSSSSLRSSSSVSSSVASFSSAYANCPSASWLVSSAYSGGNCICYNGKYYEARWWTQGQNPEQSGAWGPWKQVPSCPGVASSSRSSVVIASSSSSSIGSSSSVGSVAAVARRYVAYASTWQTSIYDLKLENIPNYITHVNLAFVRPDTNYQKGSYAFDQLVAGFEFIEGKTTYTGQRFFTAQQAQDLRNNIAALRNRGTQVWISVGGWSYSQGDQWSRFNAPRVVALAQDLGASGVDIDWESSGSVCNKQTDAAFSCTRDEEIINIINGLYNEIQARSANLGISIAGWSTGAYYVKGSPYEEGKVQYGSGFGGTLYNLVKRQGSKLNFINLMSYDAGEYYDPREGYESYRAIYSGPINMGMQVAPEGSGWSVLKINAPENTVYDAEISTGLNNNASRYYNVETLVNYIKHKGRANDGFMLWQLWKQRVHQPVSAGGATENSAGQYVCRNLPLAGDCNQTIPTLLPLQ